jgi:hypothetical protein
VPKINQQVSERWSSLKALAPEHLLHVPGARILWFCCNGVCCER